MRRRMAVLWLAAVLCLAGPALSCLAQERRPTLDISSLISKAQAGDTGAMLSLGEAYLDGAGVKRDLEAAIGLFTAVAQTGDPWALYLLSFALRERAKPGDLDQALSYGTDALTRAKRQPGSEAMVASIQKQLGGTYEKLGRHEESVIAYEAARRLFERIFGRNHLAVAGAYANLANGLRYEPPPRWLRPVCPSMDTTVQVREPRLEPDAVCIPLIPSTPAAASRFKAR